MAAPAKYDICPAQKDVRLVYLIVAGGIISLLASVFLLYRYFAHDKARKVLERLSWLTAPMMDVTNTATRGTQQDVCVMWVDAVEGAQGKEAAVLYQEKPQPDDRVLPGGGERPDTVRRLSCTADSWEAIIQADAVKDDLSNALIILSSSNVFAAIIGAVMYYKSYSEGLATAMATNSAVVLLPLTFYLMHQIYNVVKSDRFRLSIEGLFSGGQSGGAGQSKTVALSVVRGAIAKSCNNGMGVFVPKLDTLIVLTDAESVIELGGRESLWHDAARIMEIKEHFRKENMTKGLTDVERFLWGDETGEARAAVRGFKGAWLGELLCAGDFEETEVALILQAIVLSSLRSDRYKAGKNVFSVQDKVGVVVDVLKKSPILDARGANTVSFPGVKDGALCYICTGSLEAVKLWVGENPAVTRWRQYQAARKAAERRNQIGGVAQGERYLERARELGDLRVQMEPQHDGPAAAELGAEDKLAPV